MPTQFVKVYPVLASLNLDETIAFYTEKMKFEVDRNFGHYLIMRRDDLIVHFWLSDDRHIAENTSCYVVVTDVDALYAECEAAGVLHPNDKFDTRSYGMRDFAILDPHGNLIRFGEWIGD